MRKILLFIIPLLFCAFISSAQFSNSDATSAMQLISAHKATIGLTADDLSNLKITNTYVDNSVGIRYVYLIQTYQGIPVYNQMLVLAFKNDRLVSNAGVFNRSVEKLANVKNGMPPVSAESAVQSALADRGLAATQMAIVVNRKDDEHKIVFNNMGISRENITAQLMWVPIEELVNNVNVVTKVRLAWQVYIIPKTTPDYWLVRIDATDNSFIAKTNLTDYDNWGTPSQENNSVENPPFVNGNPNADFAGSNLFDFKEIKKLSEQMPDGPTIVNTATYRVVPFPAEAPSFPLGAHATRTDPWTAAAAVPNAITLKWHTGAAAADYDYTRSNNVWAYQDQANTNTGTIAKSASSTTAFPNLTFDFVPDYTVAPTQTAPVPNQQFNITNLFYWNNVMHDVMYIYGFIEAAANFQDDNLGRGGVGNDHVNAEAQDGSGTNNANFATPADGASGRMQMYLWSGSPQKDGDVDNGVICHEFGHGISNRFTGGGTAGCLGNAEQMGEGWGDYNALMFTQDWATATLNTGFNSPRGIGTYVLNQPPSGIGIRSQKYCTDFAVNNKVYLAVLPAAPHDRGEIWCATLWDMTWNIINQVGTISPTLYNLAGGGGNAIAFKLVNEGMRLQQCSPGFISGRNAILAADQALYGGTYNCAIWEAFRRRGMGAFASEGSTNSVTDQIPDFTPPLTLGATVSATTIPEGQNLIYTNSVSTCSAVAGYTLRDTLPTNVTYVSGGVYDAPNRVVSFAVNQAAGSTNYPFTVNVNPGSYFPPVTVINEPVAGATIPATWTTTAPVGTVWTVVSTQSHSAPNSFFVTNLPASGDQRLEMTTAVALPLNSYPKLSFWHQWNTEAGWDGGVVEISTNGGATWTDLGPNMITNGYNGGLGAAPTNALSGRPAFTGLQATFINTVISLAPYAGQSVKLRFRFGSDDNTSAPTSPAGWWVDDVVLNYVAAVNMRTSLFNATNTRVSFKDNVTEITQLIACAPVINTQPTNVLTCAASNASFTCVGAATGGVTYQWQESTGGPFTDIINGGVYSGATTSTLTLTGVTVVMNGRQYRCVVTGTCPPNATSTAATLTVVAASIGGTVNPANTSVCGATNSGTLTLSGHTGSVVRWESSTVGAGGPFTPIANTTTTLTFTNITQTTYYRAVVLVPGCVEAPSSVSTVTFIPSNPMLIVAVPGTTLCQGDPAALTVYEAGPVVPVTVTHSSSNTITAGNGISCGTAGLNTAINSYWRAYDLNAFPAVTGAFTINSVNFGIEQLSGGTQLFTVRLYNQTGGAFPGGTRTIIGTQTFNIPVQSGTIFTATLGTPVTVPNTSTVIVEVEKSAVVNGQFFWPGGNASAETGPSYLSAPACGITVPTTMAAIGFPNTHFVMALAGTVQGAGPVVAGGTFLWSPATGLSSTTTNPVAASPATTTTYTVLHNNGSGCIRQASITININLRPTITSHPASITVCSGLPATFTVTGTGTGVTYQWQESVAAGPFVNITNGGAYAGATTPTLTITPVTIAMNNNRYRCVLSGTCPPAGTANISNPATLTVNALPVVTVTPASGCGGVAGINGLLLTASGASTYTWAPAGGLYTNSITTIPYVAGAQTPTVYAAPTAYTAYTVSGTNAGTGCVGTAVALVNYTPPAPTVTPSSVTMCLGDPAVKLKSSSSQAFSATFNSGAMALAIPDGPATWPQVLFPGVSTPNLPVSGIPAGATITGMSVKLNLTHTYIADMVIVLKAPNGAVLNLDANINKTGGAGANFVNTIISSTSSTLLSSGAPPYTGTFQPDAVGATYTALGFTFPGGPTSPAGYIPTVSTFSGLYSVPNGNWTLGIYDWGAGDLGTLTNWELKIDYIVGVPATPAVWSPVGGLFSDVNATIPYVANTAVDSVWTRPTPSGVYTYTATVQSISLPPAAPATPMLGGNGNNTVAFNLTNSNPLAMNLTGISSNTFGSGAITARAFYKVTPIAGNPGLINAANGWIQFGGPTNSNVTAGTLNPVLTGLSLPIPGGATYGIVLELTGATFPAYTNGTGVPVSYSNGGCTITTDGNIGWGGPAAPGPMVNNPRNFNGTVYLSAASAAPCTSPGRTVVVTVNQPTTVATQPVSQTVCTDKIASFTVTPAGTGPFTYQWQVSTDNGNTFTNISNGGVYSGATSATLVITAPPVSMTNYQYRVIINGAAPCASATSFKVVLTVNPLPTVVISASPYTRLFPGLVTTLSSTVTPFAAGTGGYVWLRNGVPVVGAGTGTLSVNVDGLGAYSLRVTDIHGCTNTSNTITISDSASGKCFIYPNPNSGQFQVRYYSALNNVLPRGIVVYDGKGDKVLSQSYTIGRPYDRMDVDMRKFGKGLYWVEIVDMNGNRITMCRVVIQ